MPYYPVMDWSNLVAVLGTLLVVGLGAMLNSTNEHKRWVRQQRLETYLGLQEAMQRHDPVKAQEADWEHVNNSLWLALKNAELVSPFSVRRAYVGVLRDSTKPEIYEQSVEKVLQLMRDDLRLTQHTRKERRREIALRLRHPFSYSPPTLD